MKVDKVVVVLVIFSLVFSIIATRAGYNVPTNGLIGYWPGNGSAVDASPTGNNGSFGGSYAPGPTGLAFNLGTAKVTIPNNSAYNFKSYDGWSVGFWFSDNGTPVSADNGVFLGQDSGSGYRPKWFIDYGSSVYGNGPYYYFHVNDYNQERIFLNSDSEPPPTGWNQLTVTINNTNNGMVSFYLNGQPIGVNSLGNYVLQTDAALMLGYQEGFTFNGLMSDVVIYNRVLSTNEVMQLATIPPLAITSQPFDVSVPTGGAGTFSVGVTGGFAPFSYQWAINGTNIPGATNVSLTISNASAADVGVYTVTVSNSLQGITSQGATLTTVDIAMFAGIIVNGVLSSNFTFQSASDVAQSNWLTLTNVNLPSRPFIYIDYSSPTNAKQFYRVFKTP